MNKSIYSYRDKGDKFILYRRGDEIAAFGGVDVTNTFMRWLVDLLNRNHEEFTKNRSEKLIREMGF